MKLANAIAALHGPSDAGMTAEERRYCATRVEQRHTSAAQICIAIAIGYHSVSLVTDQLVVSPEDRSLFLSIHLTLLTLHALWLGFLRRLKRPKIDVRWFLWSLQVAYIASMGFVLNRTVGRPALGDALLASNGLMATSLLMLLLCPLKTRMVAVTTAAFIVIAAFGFWGNPIGERWLVITVFVMLATMTLQFQGIGKARAEALAEYRMLIRVAPAQVVRMALATDLPVEVTFQPALRPVACVSSDWRDFQRFSRSNEPAVVAHALSEYYTMCTGILERVAPRGNYYSDWIADELFIVFYDKWRAPTRTLAMQAMAFSKALLEEKEAFLAKHTMPQAIDLGIAVGTAFVGMMGPKDHLKATALGETPGLARRLQSAGKLLRHRLGPGDRIIVDTNVTAWLKKHESFMAYDLAPNEQLRDLDGEQLHFLMPADAQLQSSTTLSSSLSTSKRAG